MKKRFLCLVLAFVCALLLGSVVSAAGPLLEDVCVYPQANSGTKIVPTELRGESWLFLPASCDPASLAVRFTLPVKSTTVTASGAAGKAEIQSGDLLNLISLCGKNAPWKLTLTAVSGGKTESVTLYIQQSSGVGAMYLTSADPVNQGREWVESSPDKSNKATGSMVLVNEEGTLVYDGLLTQIKGRGNSTWAGAKKPYQIKLDKKTDLLETGNGDNRSKTWVLLANYFDPTLMRNSIVYDLSMAMGMEVAVESTPVDLYYDGQYRGTYLLSEKVEIGSGRVDIADLEDANEKANPEVDLEKLPVKTGSTANGATFYYCDGMQDPEDITGGYLLEMDLPNRAAQEVCYFITSRGNHVVVKSPEFASKAQMDYIASLYQDFENAVYDGGTNSDTGKAMTDYMDLTSMVRCYLINEWSKNPDGFATSAYIYKDAGPETMYMGPVWDYDLAIGIGNTPDRAFCRQSDGWYAVMNHLCRQLYQIPEFRQAVYTEYQNNMYPLLRDVLLGEACSVSADGSLHAYSDYAERCAGSAACNFRLWPVVYAIDPADSTWSDHVTSMEAYIKERTQWLTANYPDWLQDTPPVLPRYLDVAAGAWYAASVEHVTDRGYMQGFSSNQFCPDLRLTRAQMVQVLYNMAGDHTAGNNPSRFGDVMPNAWYYNAVTWGASQGIVKGYEDGLFRPENPIKRQDVVLMLYRYLGEPEVSGNRLAQVPDGSRVTPYAAQAMEWALERGLVKGYTDGTVKPQAGITRAEFATLLTRLDAIWKEA